MKKILFVIVILAVIGGYMLINTEDNNYEQQNPKLSENTTISNELSNNVEQLELSNEEKYELEKYINLVCNNTKKITEFNNINDADKEWIYSHLLTNGKTYENYITKEQIENDLKEIFGSQLKVDAIADTKSADGYYIPINDGNGNFYFLPSGGTISVKYLINTIHKMNEDYIVNVVEYSILRDLDSSNPDESYGIFTYNSANNWEKVFDKGNYSTTEINEKILQDKDKFESYDIILNKENNNYYIKEFLKH